MAFNDNNFGAVLTYAVDHLMVAHIVVCGHYFCGGLEAITGEIENPVIRDWLNVASYVLERVRAMPGYDELDQVGRMELLTEAHVLRQMDHLEQFAVVRKARKSGRALSVHGLVYDVRNGGLKRVNDGA